MKRFDTLVYAALPCLALCVVSCVTPKNTTYLRDMAYETQYAATPPPELRIQTGDRLAIVVSSEDAQLSAPFNASVIPGDGSERLEQAMAYTVNAEGDINFPVLGAIRVSGLTLAQLEKAIQTHIQERGYIRNPVVNAKLTNFKVTVISGNGNNSGVLPVEEDHINLLQAIALSNSIVPENTKIKDVMVIRTEDGHLTAYSVNLQKQELFNSPAFHLRQNDIIYVKPKGLRMSSTGSLILQHATTILGLAGTAYNLFLTYLLYSRYNTISNTDLTR